MSRPRVKITLIDRKGPVGCPVSYTHLTLPTNSRV